MVDEIEEIPAHMSLFDWSSGPDKLCPASSYISTKLNQPANLRLNGADSKLFPPMSIYTMFKKTVDQRPNHSALAFKSNQDGPWAIFSYLEYWKICHKAAKSFIKLGLDKSECVGIIGFNSPQWFISIIGAIFAGGIGCGIYTTNSAEACEYILKDSKSQIIVVENKQQLDKIMTCKKNVPIKKIIQYSGVPENNYNGLVLSWNEFIEFGSDVDQLILDLRIKSIAPNKCATLIYTSGTTGIPKAAMISHDNVTYLIRYIGGDIAKLRPFSETIVSYLPLSHIAAQAVDLYAPIHLGMTVYFAQPDALKGSLSKTLKEVRPTYFFGVPRIWEKMQESIEKNVKNLTGTKLELFKWSRKVASQQITSQFENRAGFSPSYSLAKLLVLNNVHSQLGLDKCRSFYSGAAPITKDTLDFFISLGIPLCEVYGMSESTGPHSIGTVHLNRACSVGAITQFNQSRIIGKDEDGSGELVINGRHVFMGYLNDEKKSNEAFDEQGWLRTGDIAKITDNFLFITGRLKELIITAGGENIAPVPIEDNVRAELPRLISNCMLVGDKRKYLVMLVTLKSKIDMETMAPIDDLAVDCVDFVKKLGSNSNKVTDIIEKKDQLVYKAIEAGITKANEKSTSRAAKVQKFFILPRDFSLANGELGPTLKLRRPIVTKMYSDVIDALYAENGNSNE